MKKLNLMDENYILKSCKYFLQLLDWALDGMDLLEEVKMLRNITPEKSRSYNALKHIIKITSLKSIFNMIIAYGYS
jgi:hypothetical protein